MVTIMESFCKTKRITKAICLLLIYILMPNWSVQAQEMEEIKELTELYKFRANVLFAQTLANKSKVKARESQYFFDSYIEVEQTQSNKEQLKKWIHEPNGFYKFGRIELSNFLNEQLSYSEENTMTDFKTLLDKYVNKIEALHPEFKSEWNDYFDDFKSKVNNLYKEYETMCKDIIEKDPISDGQREKYEKLIKRGDDYLDDKNYKKAIDSYENALNEIETFDLKNKIVETLEICGDKETEDKNKKDYYIRALSYIETDKNSKERLAEKIDALLDNKEEIVSLIDSFIVFKEESFEKLRGIQNFDEYNATKNSISENFGDFKKNKFGSYQLKLLTEEFEKEFLKLPVPKQKVPEEFITQLGKIDQLAEEGRFVKVYSNITKLKKKYRKNEQVRNEITNKETKLKIYYGQKKYPPNFLKRYWITIFVVLLIFFSAVFLRFKNFIYEKLKKNKRGAAGDTKQEEDTPKAISDEFNKFKKKIKELETRILKLETTIIELKDNYSEGDVREGNENDVNGSDDLAGDITESIFEEDEDSTTVDLSPEIETVEPIIKFAKIFNPNSKGFRDEALSDERTYQQIFEILIDPNNPKKAKVQVTTDPEGIKKALVGPKENFKDCGIFINNPPEQCNFIETVEPGKLELFEDGIWRFLNDDDKIQIRFEKR